MWSDAKASVIVLTTSPTLNPLSPNYRWTDQGAVVSGPAGVTHSCIDPAPLLDADGNFWIVWGGGYPFATDVDSIFLTPLDKLTGLPLTSDPGYRPPNLPGYALGQGHKEGPYIHYHAGSYYFFYQTGSCCDGAASTYTIHVARSQSVKGPYTGDRTFYASRGSIHGPGHMGVYRACGFERFTYHYYPDTGGSVVGENELVWTADGWPSVGAESTTPLKLCGPTGTIGAGADAGIGRTADADSQGGTGGAAVTDASVERATAGGASGAGGTAGSGGSATGAGGSGLDGSGAGGAGDEGPATGGSTESGDASGSIEHRSDPGSSGCSCRVAVPRRSEGAGGVWLLGFALAAFVRRNKRARRELGGQPGEWRRRLEGRLAEAR
jgi:hypothetical protein